VARLIVNPHVLRCFLRPSLTEVPSLHRSYPASTVLRTSPPPHTAWPSSRELPVDPLTITAGASRVAPDPLRLHAVATTPAGPMERIRSLRLHRRRPSPDYSWVGSCINSFEACSAFTRVTTCRLAKSPYATLYTGGSGGFVASTAAPIATGWSDPVPGRAFLPLWTSAFSRRTVIAVYKQLSNCLTFRQAGGSPSRILTRCASAA
jgi:hypothetical protein